MKALETFVDFHTHFLHLARQAKILKDNLQLDLFDILTLELQRTVLLVYSMHIMEKNSRRPLFGPRLRTLIDQGTLRPR